MRAARRPREPALTATSTGLHSRRWPPSLSFAVCRCEWSGRSVRPARSNGSGTGRGKYHRGRGGRPRLQAGLSSERARAQRYRACEQATWSRNDLRALHQFPRFELNPPRPAEPNEPVAVWVCRLVLRTRGRLRLHTTSPSCPDPGQKDRLLRARMGRESSAGYRGAAAAAPSVVPLCSLCSSPLGA